ncbi:MepB family protein [Streptomyces sp. SID13666]|uniref:MepB family protein n=1 Tax=unclassified Streptomyces TaxID=2593676 RepID=UPI0013C0FBC2|nr:MULTISPECIES: MepB family protein [unclassified Streptomyces]NEA52676.1 MepB family protein [Streptomyces sp. SID13666]NEA69997.1 MepB family protein [Streptomyces sp. SID13588]
MSTGPGTSTGPDPWTSSAGPLHSDLLAAKTRVYDVNGFVCSRPVPEPESADYGAHEFTLDGASVRFRVARTTPTKIGQFVTVWKRSPEGPIQPFDSTDAVDLLVVSSREDQHFGQFVFPRDVLCERDVVSRNGVGGKRAFRVYPPWATAVNRQARASQAWQLRYFLRIPEDGPADAGRARALYHP